MSTPFLEVEDFETHFPVETGLIFKRRLSAVPTVDPRRERKRIVLPGDPPSPMNPPIAAVFIRAVRT